MSDEYQLKLENGLNPCDQTEQIYTFFYENANGEKLKWCGSFNFKEGENPKYLFSRAINCLLQSNERIGEQ